MDSEYKATMPTESGLHFTGVNTNWGTITKNPDSTEYEDICQWYVFVYYHNSWVSADSLWKYTPFDDNSSYPAANVVLCWSLSNEPVEFPSVDDLQPLTHVEVGDERFRIDFDITRSNGSKHIVGYGSDAVLALYNAVETNNLYESTINLERNEQYGTIDKLDGIGNTCISASNYIYYAWTISVDSKSSTELKPSVFSDTDGCPSLGLYTPVDGFDLSCNTISLVYEEITVG